MDKYQRVVYLGRFIAEHRRCLVCSGRVDDITNAMLGKIDTSLPFKLYNLGIRHKTCVRHKYKRHLFVESTEQIDIENIVEDQENLDRLVTVMMATSADKQFCKLCDLTWVGAEFDDLKLDSRGRVVHKACEQESKSHA